MPYKRYPLTYFNDKCVIFTNDKTVTRVMLTHKVLWESSRRCAPGLLS